MVKDDFIFLRVDRDVKRRIEAAARSRGQSLTSFILKAVGAEAGRAESRPPAKGKHTGVPTYFQVACGEAERGGNLGYRHPGYILASNVASERPHGIEESAWLDEVDRLIELLDDQDEGAVWDWLRGHYPKMMDLVPARRVAQFVRGVLEAHQDEKVQW